MIVHDNFMEVALHAAEAAYEQGEVPVGAVIVYKGEVVSVAHNLCEAQGDPTAHAEMLAIKEACKKKDNWRLDGCDLYVTLEPCPMCMGAILNARIKTVYYGAMDEKFGALGSVCDLSHIPGYLHTTYSKSGILKDKCSDILKKFFKEKRKG